MVSDDSRSVFSDAAIITLDLPLSVLTQPNNVTVKPGESVKFSVKAQGNGTLSYQWYYKKADADDWAIWNGRTTASITPTSNSSWNMMQVRCMVSNGADSIYSDAATITIDQPLVILTQPDNITEKPGTNVVCSVKAQGKGTLKYQWYYKEASAENWTVWEDHTTANITFEIDSTWNMKQVRCMVTDDAGSNDRKGAGKRSIEISVACQKGRCRQLDNMVWLYKPKHFTYFYSQLEYDADALFGNG